MSQDIPFLTSVSEGSLLAWAQCHFPAKPVSPFQGTTEPGGGDGGDGVSSISRYLKLEETWGSSGSPPVFQQRKLNQGKKRTGSWSQKR